MTTLFDRLFEPHIVADLGAGSFLVAIDRVMLHERTGAAALASLATAGRPIMNPAHAFAVMDHIVDTRPGRGDETPMPGGSAFIRETRAAAQAAGITLIDVTDRDQGITHIVAAELGIVLPGLTLVAPDSHTCTQGAVGALAWGIGSSEAEHALATGTLRVVRPRLMRVWIEGALQPGVTAKDLAIHIIASHGADGGRGHAVEYAGPATSAMTMDERFTLANMATEFGAFTALMAPDAIVFEALAGRRHGPADYERAVRDWQMLKSDASARFDREIRIDAAAVEPMLSWGTSPAQSLPVDGRVPADAPPRALSYMGLEPGQRLAGLPIDGAFIGSCTNSRLSDLRRVAAILRGRQVHPRVRAICVPGSQAVKRAAEAEGIDNILRSAGFEWRESGCSMCFYAGGESFGAGQRVVSSTNRNFEHRQGPGTRTHIASPETVAASALDGAIADPRRQASGGRDDMGHA